MEIMDISHVLLVETKSADFLFPTESKIFLWSERGEPQIDSNL